MLIEQAPANAGVAVPVRTKIEVAEVPARRRASMPAPLPFAVDFAVTVAAVVGAVWVWVGVDPLIRFVVLARQGTQSQRNKASVRRGAADEESLLPCRYTLLFIH